MLRTKHDAGHQEISVNESVNLFHKNFFKKNNKIDIAKINE